MLLVQFTNVGVKRLFGQNKSNYKDEDLSFKTIVGNYIKKEIS
ncbi:MAG: hypothetical protein QJR05_06505 [Thermoanaerobacterium sp.]|nr:hypothetical protein [Thermoanaerobacterium sp.]